MPDTTILDQIAAINDSPNGHTASEEAIIRAKLILKDLNSQHTEKFPLQVFPKPLADIVQCWHDCYGFSIDWYGASVLSAASTVIANAYSAQYHYKWTESPGMYIAIVGYSGTGKSKAINHGFGPIYTIQNENFNDLSIRMEQWNQNEMERKASKTSDDPIPKPEAKRLYLMKFTLEKLQRILSKNPRGCAVIRQELTGWLKSMNQYRAGDDEETWLEIWDHDDISIDTLQGTFIIPKANVTVIGGVQPRITEIFAENNRSENGSLARILFAFPDDLEKPKPTKIFPDKSVFDHYEAIIRRLHELPQDTIHPLNEYDAEKIQPIPLELSNQAKDLFYEFLCQNTEAQNATKDDLVKSIYSKMDAYCLRFACVLRLMQVVTDPKAQTDIDSMRQVQINSDNIQNAIRLVNYFKSTALKITSRLESKAQQELSREQLAWYRAIPDEVRAKDAVDSAKALGIGERTVYKILGNKDLFRKNQNKTYERISY